MPAGLEMLWPELVLYSLTTYSSQIQNTFLLESRETIKMGDTYPVKELGEMYCKHQYSKLIEMVYPALKNLAYEKVLVGKMIGIHASFFVLLYF